MCWNPDGIVHLYDVVLQQERKSNVDITEEQWESQIRKGLEQIVTAHNPRTQSLLSSSRVSVDYNQNAVRCAYIHRFASIYTGLAYEMLSSALRQKKDLRRILYPKLTYLQLCCLGGGPGTDLVGVWTALYHYYFQNFHGSATVVDEMSGWSSTVNSVITELQNGNYPVSPAFNPFRFDWSFLTANLLGDMTPVQETIRCADMVTMFKFLSAAACEDTEEMLEKVFNIMKPGALVFFINNAAGGFHELVNRVARNCRFITIFGPLLHIDYYHINSYRFGIDSLWKTKVTVQILMKPQPHVRKKTP